MAKSTTVKLKDLPQGFIASEEPVEEDPVTLTQGFPAVIEGARQHMLKYSSCVVLTRVGGFYEFYFEQAETWGKQLGLKVASKKTKGTGSAPRLVPMAGFPWFQLHKYLQILVKEHGCHVAIAEEIPNTAVGKSKTNGLLFDRQVKRVVTPGTLIDESFLPPTEHNYLLSIYVDPQSSSSPSKDSAESSSDQAPLQSGLAWVDLSSGDFYVQQIQAQSLGSAIARINPREVVFDQSWLETSDPVVSKVIAECTAQISYFNPLIEESASASESGMSAQTAPKQVENESMTVEESESASMLLTYVGQQLPGLRLQLQPAQRFRAKEHMSIDRSTQRGLELFSTIRERRFDGSLLHAVRKTCTKSGARLLALRLASPSMSLVEINERLDLVESFKQDDTLLEEIRRLLGETADTFRLTQSIACGKGDADDLLSLSKTIQLTRHISNRLSQASSETFAPFAALLERFQWDGPERLAERILDSIDDEALQQRHRSQENDEASAVAMTRKAIAADSSDEMAALHKRLNSSRMPKAFTSEEEEVYARSEDIWIMRRGASDTLNSLHGRLEELFREKGELTAQLRSELGASSLTLRMTPGDGHIVHVQGKDTKLDLGALPEKSRMVRSSRSTRSMHVPDWADLGSRIEEAKLRVRTEEHALFQELRKAVCDNLVALRKNAGALDDLDVATSGATLAISHGLTRPVLTNGTNLSITGGRHMTVEANLARLGRTFTPNDCYLGSATATATLQAQPKPGTERIQLITGPNMAGKSTYLRQTALIAIMAQTGLFVPATHAELGLTDAVFSRVGSADDLANDQSTFMVEMVETAAILKEATHKSLVVMDEVGRGTTPEDGMAVGYAVLDWLRSKTNAAASTEEAAAGEIQESQHGSSTAKAGPRALFATHFHGLTDMVQDWPELSCWCTRVVEESERSFHFDHKMRRGINRDSHALKVARLAGMPEEAIKVAEQYLEGLKGR